MRSKQCLKTFAISIRVLFEIKLLSLKDYTLDRDTDLFALTETWLEPGNNDGVLIEELSPTGYKFLHNPRSSGRGGGVGSFVSKDPQDKARGNYESDILRIHAGYL